MTEEALFHAALAVPAAERAAYLDAHCADPELRRRVDDLLAAHDGSAGPLDGTGAYAPSVTPASAPGSTGARIGPYKLLQLIGEGGMGEVWMAEQEQPVRRRVAVKVIKAGMDSRQVIARFEAERQALAMMDHVHIAKVLDAGTTADGRPFFVMELIRGEAITRFCDAHHLTPRERLELFVPVCQAIQHAHQKGVIHRDLKPSNVLVTLYDGRPVPKVIDFGVAKALHQRLTDKTMFTEFGAVVGTLEYMAPEQAELSHLDVDTRSDVYSLGVLLYELLTGTTPLDRTRLRSAAFDEMLRIIREEEPPKPSTRLSRSGDRLPSIAAQRKTEPAKLSRLVRGELDWIVMKALEKDRSRRYETANAFARDVQRYLGDEPVEACPPSAGYRVRKFARRNKGPVLAASLMLLTVVGGIVGTTWGLVRADAARRAEEEQRRLAQANEQQALAAADAERTAKETAQTREAEARAVLAFVQDRVFAAARPKGQKGGLGHDITLRRALEAALPLIQTSFAHQPLIEARLRMELGLSFQYLGEAKLAAEQFEISRALYGRHLGADHPDTLESMHNLAGGYADVGRDADALKLNELTLARRKATLGPDHADTLRSMNSLANNYSAVEREADALKLREETLALRKAKLGPDHPDTLESMHSLAYSYDAVNRGGDALKLREETLALRKAKLGPDHPDTLDSLFTLARSYDALGRSADALKLREETLALRKDRLGPDHPDTLWSMNDLALSYFNLGRHADALKLREETLALRKLKLGLDHPDTLWSRDELALSYDALGRSADALKLREETLALRKVKLGDHPDVLRNMDDLAGSYYSLNRYADAAKLYEEALTIRKAKLGPDHADTVTNTYCLAASYACLDRNAEAFPLFERAFVQWKAKPGPDHPDTLLSMWGMVASLIALDRGAEAVPIIDECLRRAAGKEVSRDLIPRVFDLRLRHFEKARDAAGCRATAEMWEKLNRSDAGSLYTAAVMRAVTANVVRQAPSSDADRIATDESDRAMSWLRKALGAGYSDVGPPTQDGDLAVLRGRSDFADLLWDLADAPAPAAGKGVAP